MSSIAQPAGTLTPTWSRIRRLLRGRGSLAGLLVLIVVAILISPGFTSIANIRNLLSQNAPIGIIAIPMTILILTRDFDLSVGGVYALASVEAASIAQSDGLVSAILVVLAIGICCGIVNGIIVVLAGVNSFVATLGTGSVFAGLAYEISHDQATFVQMPSFTVLGAGRVAGVPYCVILLLALAIAAAVALRLTVFGRHIFAIGGNPEAAYLAGARVSAIRIVAFALVGLGAALGGLVFTSQVGVGQANIGSSIPLQAIAIVVVGGTSLAGGEGGIAKTIVGLLILGILTNVTNALALNSSIQMIVQGVVIVLAVAADAPRLRARVRLPRRRGTPPPAAFSSTANPAPGPIASTGAGSIQSAEAAVGSKHA